MPLGEVSVNWPAFAEFNYALPSNFFFAGSINMVAVNLFRLLCRNVVEFVLLGGHREISARKLEKKGLVSRT